METDNLVADAAVSATRPNAPDCESLIKRVASIFNTAHSNNRAQLVVLFDTLDHWRIYGDSRPVRLMLTRANGKAATRITAKPEKLATYATINRIVRGAVSGVVWKFDANEQTGMTNPVKDDKPIVFNSVVMDKLAKLAKDDKVTIISKDVREAFPPERKSNPTIEKRVAAEVKWCADNAIELAALITALQTKAKELAAAA